jgi:hypothetical protein
MMIALPMAFWCRTSASGPSTYFLLRGMLVRGETVRPF